MIYTQQALKRTIPPALQCTSKIIRPHLVKSIVETWRNEVTMYAEARPAADHATLVPSSIGTAKVSEPPTIITAASLAVH